MARAAFIYINTKQFIGKMERKFAFHKGTGIFLLTVVDSYSKILIRAAKRKQNNMFIYTDYFQTTIHKALKPSDESHSSKIIDTFSKCFHIVYSIHRYV